MRAECRARLRRRKCLDQGREDYPEQHRNCQQDCVEKDLEYFSRKAKIENVIVSTSLISFFYIFEKYEEFTNPVVKAYMKYFATRNADSRETEAINNQVSFYKTDTFIRNKYITYEFDLHESREGGRKEGKAEAETKALEEKKAMAKGLRDDGVSLDIISKRTGFTIDELKAL